MSEGTGSEHELVRRILGEEGLPGRGMQRLDHGQHIYELLAEVVGAGVEGEVVELGCNAGLTAVLLQATLDELGSAKALHVFDSFEGLPDPTPEDGEAATGRGSCAATRAQLTANFERFGAKLPVIHEGWFRDTLPGGLPDRIAFAHLDADLYSSTLAGLQHLYPRLTRRALLLLHDYVDPSCRAGVPDHVLIEDHVLYPGVKSACDEFLSDKPERIELLFTGGVQSGQGFLRKA